MAKRIVLGGDGAGNMLFRVSKPGKSAYSTDLRDFLMHESFLLGIPLMKVVVTTLNAYSNAGWYYGTLTIPHNLGFFPFVVVSGNAGQNLSPGAAVLITFDDTNIYVNTTKYNTISGSTLTLDSPISIVVYNLAVQ